MNKATVIVLSTLWAVCTIYIALAQFYGYPYRIFALLGACITTLLLLVYIVMYIRRHRAGNTSAKH
jgi:uncharacterized sodium:solute symporter family permease YidK